MFTGHEFADGGKTILETLKEQKINASFFLTGDFYRNPKFKSLIESIRNDSHYLGPHSDRHLLYCDWKKRDSLLVSRKQFMTDLEANFHEMRKFGVSRSRAPFFLPPYEWFNDTIASWSTRASSILINYTPGTISHADYTTPEMKNYRSSDVIYNSIVDYEARHGMNGFILLMHIGTDPKRTDKFYSRLNDLLIVLKRKYTFVKIDELLPTTVDAGSLLR